MAAEPMTCYRHPGRETYVACSNCLRPICTDCMVQTAVGIKCPECAGVPSGMKKVKTSAQRAVGTGEGMLVTKTLIGINAVLFVVELASGGLTSQFVDDYALVGGEVANGQWWRVVTAAFLHFNLIHLGLNMLMLWWFGGPLESLIGRRRFLTIYGLSILAGAAGALIQEPVGGTIGASGAVFGILGAGLVLERRGIPLYGGAALGIVVFNLIFGIISNTTGSISISVGGHIGGLVGGALAMLVFMHFRRDHPAYSKIDAATVLGLVAIAVGSLLVVYFRVRGYAT
jgi:membrane associated rhomboid family serine protease